MPAPVTWVLALALFWAPLPFGSVTRAGVVALELAAAVALALSATRRRSYTPARAALPAAALALVALLGLLQSVPLPEGLAGSLPAARQELLRQARPLLPEASAPRWALSLAPATTRTVALFWAVLAAYLFAAAHAGRHRRDRRTLAAALLAAAAFQVLYGARRWFAGATTIWGHEVPGTSQRLRGTFVNADHLALYLEMALAVALALAWWGWRRAHRAVAWERKLLLAAPPSVLWVFLFVGLAFTGSRAGLVAAIFGAMVQGSLLAASRRRKRWALAGALTIALGLGAVATIGYEQGFGRWMRTSPYEVGWNARVVVYRAVWGLWQRFPWLGTGLGTFREGFPLVQPAEVGDLVWWHAHSDLLELLMTVGLVGFAVVAAGLALLVRRLWRVLAAGERSEDRAAALAALGALAAVAAHEVVDFGLTMPANAVTLAVLTGAAVGVGGVRRRSRRRREEGDPAGVETGAGEGVELEESWRAVDREVEPQGRIGPYAVD